MHTMNGIHQRKKHIDTYSHMYNPHAQIHTSKPKLKRISKYALS